MKTYTIPKGRNYSREWWRKRPLWKPTGMRAILRFDHSMIYESENDGWQKLCGFSRGHHHDNSFRFVWRCWDGFFEIGAYCYLNGKRYVAMIWQKPIKKILLNAKDLWFKQVAESTLLTKIDMTISWHKGMDVMFKVMVDGFNYSQFFAQNDKLPSIGYTLHPYYEDPKSNPNTAPHDITFQMEVEYF